MNETIRMIIRCSEHQNKPGSFDREGGYMLLPPIDLRDTEVPYTLWGVEYANGPSHVTLAQTRLISVKVFGRWRS